MQAESPAALAPAAAEVEQALARVYELPELAPTAPSPLTVWLADLWTGFWEWVRSLLPDNPLGGLEPLAWIAAGLLVAGAVAVLVHLTRTGAVWWLSRDRRWSDPDDGGGLAAAPVPADWDARALALAEAGRWREAALALYQALVLWLDARGAVRYDASKTPGDYRRELRAHPVIAPRLDAFLRGFEPAAFGSRPLDAAGFDRLRALAGEARVHG